MKIDLELAKDPDEELQSLDVVLESINRTERLTLELVPLNMNLMTKSIELDVDSRHPRGRKYCP